MHYRQPSPGFSRPTRGVEVVLAVEFSEDHLDTDFKSLGGIRSEETELDVETAKPVRTGLGVHRSTYILSILSVGK